MPGSKNTEIWKLKFCFFYLVNIGLAVLWYICSTDGKFLASLENLVSNICTFHPRKCMGYIALAAKGLILATVGWVCIRSTVMCVNASVLFTGLCVC